MITIQRILCPTDLSSESDEALRYAVALASAYEAKLFLLYCRDAKSKSNGNGGKETKIDTAALFTASLGPHMGSKNFSDIDWQGLVVENVAEIGKAIVEQAGKQNIDLIVMRSRRRGRVAILLGSTAETVCRAARCPILVTHPEEREWVGLSSGEIDLRRILVAYDFSADSELALNYGLAIAQEYQAELHLLNVIADAEPGEPEAAWTGEATGSAYVVAAQKLQRAIPKEVFLWCQITSVVRYGKAADEVLSYATEHDVDLICLGSSSTDSGRRLLFGSNVDRVLRKAPCPVLIARPIRPAD